MGFKYLNVRRSCKAPTWPQVPEEQASEISQPQEASDTAADMAMPAETAAATPNEAKVLVVGAKLLKRPTCLWIIFIKRKNRLDPQRNNHGYVR